MDYRKWLVIFLFGLIFLFGGVDYFLEFEYSSSIVNSTIWTTTYQSLMHYSNQLSTSFCHCNTTVTLPSYPNHSKQSSNNSTLGSNYTSTTNDNNSGTSSSSVPSLSSSTSLSDVSSLPGYHTLTLTHYVMAFWVHQLDRAELHLKFWKKFPPCIPSKNRGPQPEFVIYVQLLPSLNDSLAKIDQSLRPLYDAANGSQCFSGYSLRYTHNIGDEDSYYTGARRSLEKIFENDAGVLQPTPLKNPSYVLYLEPDSIPIRPEWLTAWGALCVWPQPQFWIKGSFYRGGPWGITNPWHINGNALYNVADVNFKNFWFQDLIPYIRNFQILGGPHDIFLSQYLYDERNYWKKTREVWHKFVVGDGIHNYYEGSVKEQWTNFPETFMLHKTWPDEVWALPDV